MKNLINKKFVKCLDEYFNSKGKEKFFLKRKLKTLSMKIKNLYILRSDLYVIFKNIIPNNDKNLKNKLLFIAKLFGRLLKQNKSGKYYLEITPNLKKLSKLKKNEVKENLRYHQTNLGGSIHSDGPQHENPPKFLFMFVNKSAKKGGGSIVVNTKKVYENIKRNHPKEFKILSEKFIFERRGFYTKKNDAIFKKKIFKINKKGFCFRYLREYIEKGYSLGKKLLSNDQLAALNLLDKKLQGNNFQKKYKLETGDMILLNNNILAHGRTGFKIENNNKRSLYRMWVK
jgi:alpha-ketoglutarate-dependent taurine dioxygenase